MSNELLWIVFMVVNFGLILLFYRFFGKAGLYSWISMATILANIQVLKTVEIFGMVATLGNIMYATSFLATDILSENHGKQAARTGMFLGFGSMLVMLIVMQIALLFSAHESDFIQGSLQKVFGIMPRVVLGSVVAYLLSQYHDIWAFAFWRKRNSKLWIANNLSTMVSQLLDTFVFSFIAFFGLFAMNVWWQIVLTTYLFKWITALCDTPFIYLAQKIGQKNLTRKRAQTGIDR